MARDDAAEIYLELWDKYVGDTKLTLSDDDKLSENISLARFINTDELGHTKNTSYNIIYTGNDVVLFEQVTCGARTDIRAVARVSKVGLDSFCNKIRPIYRKRASNRHI